MREILWENAGRQFKEVVCKILKLRSRDREKCRGVEEEIMDETELMHTNIWVGY